MYVRKRHFLGETTTPFLPISPSHASQSTASNSTEVLNQLRPPKPDWYFELYGYFRSAGMERYEKEIAVYKRKLFANLVGKAETVLEIGIGAGPNIKYYNNIPNVSVLGVDPNPKMESHARKSAIEAGVKSENFKFIHAVAESMPLEDASVDAVVGSLVMCSVTDIPQTLEGAAVETSADSVEMVSPPRNALEEGDSVINPPDDRKPNPKKLRDAASWPFIVISFHLSFSLKF
ncbi:hypothetical protein Bca52824_014716 [Brassica carinata]|uniref:Methyltransferase type 11 domain-containing protein n=1 Tax=Brassica carinata TaxID=52824 RepID=A0A8X8B4P9_BRACI|nr:hypothetical protein Bca52824_014716 [Brassica carinata]